MEESAGSELGQAELGQARLTHSQNVLFVLYVNLFLLITHFFPRVSGLGSL